MTAEDSVGTQHDDGAARLELAAWSKDIRLRALHRLALEPEKPPRILRIGALVLLLVLHAILLIGLRNAMRPPAVAGETAVEVIFLQADLPEPPLPVPLPLTSHRPMIAPRVAARIFAPPQTAAATATPAPSAETNESPQLFNLDGSIRLPRDAVPAPTSQQISAELMQRGHNLLHCRKTRFAGGYKRDESMGDEIARKYLVWIGMYNPATEEKAQLREAAAAAACDG